MPQSLQIQTQKYTEEAKNCIKVKNAKAIENNKENVMKSQTKQENQNCKNFVKLNKEITFVKLSRIMVENIEEFIKQGIIYLNILVLYIF